MHPIAQRAFIDEIEKLGMDKIAIMNLFKMMRGFGTKAIKGTGEFVGKHSKIQTKGVETAKNMSGVAGGKGNISRWWQSAKSKFKQGQKAGQNAQIDDALAKGTGSGGRSTALKNAKKNNAEVINKSKGQETYLKGDKSRTKKTQDKRVKKEADKIEAENARKQKEIDDKLAADEAANKNKTSDTPDTPDPNKPPENTPGVGVLEGVGNMMAPGLSQGAKQLVGGATVVGGTVAATKILGGRKKTKFSFGVE
ncbi:hypothetical protein H8D85_01570 [bacterium]|nr:hypothetical protein [bacterium]